MWELIWNFMLLGSPRVRKCNLNVKPLLKDTVYKWISGQADRYMPVTIIKLSTYCTTYRHGFNHFC